MTDLVERLRKYPGDLQAEAYWKLVEDAADEIERLRALTGDIPNSIEIECPGCHGIIGMDWASFIEKQKGK